MNSDQAQKVNASSRKLGWLALAGSTSTLICCALPILLVSLGAGALSAALFANFPFLVVLAKNKLWLFTGSAVMLTLAAWSLYRPGRACPAELELAEQCRRSERLSRRLLLISGLIWAIGFSAAYLAAPLYRWLA